MLETKARIPSQPEGKNFKGQLQKLKIPSIFHAQ
jgi:hypothetical protein